MLGMHVGIMYSMYMYIYHYRDTRERETATIHISGVGLVHYDFRLVHECCM